MTSFALARDAKLSTPATAIAWCPTMDVLVVACARGGGTLTAHRLSWQKIWTQTLDASLDAPTVVSFRPDGKVFAVGYASGAVTTHATEDGETLRTMGEADGFGRADGGATTSLLWREATVGATHADESKAAKFIAKTTVGSATTRGQHQRGSRERRGDGAASRLDAAAERARPISERFESNGRLDALFATNAAGAVAMHAFGMFRIGLWDTHDVVGGRLLPLTTSEDFSRVEAVATASGAAAFAHLDASYVSDHAREVYLASVHASHLMTTLESMRATLEDARGKFESGYREPFAKALSKFNDTLSLMFTSVDASMDPANELRKHLEITLVTGTFDEPLEHFFTTSLKMGQVKRLAKDIDAALSSIHETLVAAMSPLMDAVVLRLGSLLTLARMSYGDEGIGLREATIETAIALVEQFMYDLISTARAVTTRACQLRAFFVFIVRAQMISEGLPAHGTNLPAPRLDLVRDFMSFAFTKNGLVEPLDAALGRSETGVPTVDDVVDKLGRLMNFGQKRAPKSSFSLAQTMRAIEDVVSRVITAPAELIQSKCRWMVDAPIAEPAVASMFSNARTLEKRDCFRIDASRECVHVYRVVDGSRVRVATVSTPNEHVVDAQPYKKGQLVALLKPRDATSGQKARLVLLDDDVMTALPLDGSVVEVNSLELRQRALPSVEPLAPLAVSHKRGLGAVLVSSARVQLYDLEDDEEEEEEE